MTREEILALQPGPDLDRLVCEKVMGWRYTIGESSHKGRVIAWPDPDKEGVEFNVSSLPGPALFLVHHLRGKGGGVSLWMTSTFTEVWVGLPECKARNESMSLAVCQAALLWQKAVVG